jgi:hypothetical protein
MRQSFQAAILDWRSGAWLEPNSLLRCF